MPPRPPKIRPVNPDTPEFVHPRLPGETEYAYRTRRSLAMFGMTPYQRRVANARARGKSTSEARGHGRAGGETESQRRNRIAFEQTGFTVSQLRRQELTGWLVQNGYTPVSTGMTQTQLLNIAARLRYMNDTTGPGGRVTPNMILEATSLEEIGQLEKGWAFERLWQKFDDMINYRNYRNKVPGAQSWAEYQAVHDEVPEVAIQFWYYH